MEIDDKLKCYLNINKLYLPNLAQSATPSLYIQFVF